MGWWFSCWVVWLFVWFAASAGIPRGLCCRSFLGSHAPPSLCERGVTPPIPLHPWVPAFAGMTCRGRGNDGVVRMGFRFGWVTASGDW